MIHESIRVLYLPDRKAAIIKCSLGNDLGKFWYLGNKADLERAGEITCLLKDDPSVRTLDIDAQTAERLVALAEDQRDHRRRYSSASEDLQVAEKSSDSEAIRKELERDMDKARGALQENDSRINKFLRGFGIEFVATRP